MIVGGLPDLGADPIEAREILRTQHDWVRAAAILEPRGSDVLVGAALLPRSREGADAAVVYFNNAGYLNMCGHATIGLITTLAFMGKVATGAMVIDTPPGRIHAELHADGRVSFENVASYRFLKNVSFSLPGHGPVTGDVAYGGNWFFLVNGYKGSIDLASVDALSAFCRAVREELAGSGITGKDGAEIDHIEILGPTPKANARSFVLCPGAAYDRSPCGTGTSAKLACLYEDGKIKEGEIWRQESVVGSVFEGRVSVRNGLILPTIKGQAWITSRGTLILDAGDPFRYGLLPIN